MQTAQDKQSKFVFYPLRYPQPMKITEERRYVFMLPLGKYRSCSSVENRLKTINVMFGKSGKRYIAIVQPAEDERGHKCLQDLSRH